MSNTKSYRVMMKDKTEVSVSASDVDLNTCHGDNENVCEKPAHYYNFLNDNEETIAVFPFDEVLYIKS